MVDLIQRTALDLPKEEWNAYHPMEAILQRQRANRAKMDRRRKRAMRLARQAASLLRTDFGAGRVVLFGSLASRSGFSLWSDIDLAVWGITPERFYAAVAAITGLSADFKVELVDSENCSTSLRKAIVQDGIDL